MPNHPGKFKWLRPGGESSDRSRTRIVERHAFDLGIGTRPTEQNTERIRINDAEEIDEAKAEIERLCEELAAAQKDATRYWWVARNCDVWHATFGAIGSNRELDAAMAKESERE